MKWQYGLTTVLERKDTTLPITIGSLKNAGFDKPRLFVDGAGYYHYDQFHLPITARAEKIKTLGNWLLGMLELYLRDPHADYYAMFQDDAIFSRGIREYIERTPLKEKGYLNLMSFPANEVRMKGKCRGWHPSNQLGLSAVALVFPRVILQELLISRSFVVCKPAMRKSAGAPHIRSWKSVDGGVVEAMKRCQVKEFVHNPSLCQHIGDVSVMGNDRHPKSATFQGEDFDVLSLLS